MPVPNSSLLLVNSLPISIQKLHHDSLNVATNRFHSMGRCHGLLHLSSVEVLYTVKPFLPANYITSVQHEAHKCFSVFTPFGLTPFFLTRSTLAASNLAWFIYTTMSASNLACRSQLQESQGNLPGTPEPQTLAVYIRVLARHLGDGFAPFG